MKEARPNSRILLTLAFTGMITFLDMMLFESEMFASSTEKLIAHAGLTLGLIAVLCVCWRMHFDMRFLLLFGLFLAALGPFGGLLIFAALVLYFLYSKVTTPIVDLLNDLIPSIDQDASTVLHDRILYHLDDFHPDRLPVPFKDIMAYGTANQKRTAIEKMLRYYQPEFAGALRAGLDDPNNSIRVQAATALSSIDHKYFAAHMALKSASESNRDNTARLKDYAEQMAVYSCSEILDPDRRKSMQQKAIAAYESYLLKEPHDAESHYMLAKLYYETGNYTEANRLLAKEPPDGAAASLLHLETLYALGDYDALQAYASSILELQRKQPIDEKTLAAARLWAEGYKPAHTLQGGAHG